MATLNKSTKFKGIDGPLLTIVMDGVGIAPDTVGNAVKQAYTPTLDMIMEKLKISENQFVFRDFKEIYDLKGCACLFVGHHKDDFIETYLMQKARNAVVDYYGINKEVEIQGMKVVRPLLEYSKKDLEEYCNKHGIVFGVDETNYDLNYSRNNL